ncbi:MAG: hypothetical protein DRN27_07695 [Thermoplasmata archaeon]|nr:MAG: hypothetical protein DRN27_07695 [Thermoplasmata archaeon]
MIGKSILVCICTTLLILMSFPTMAEPEILNVNDPPFEDPDGPREGGLDDATDFIHLAKALLVLRTMNVAINETQISDFDNIIHLIMWSFSICGVFVFYVIFDFLEAFDIMEIEFDGC